MTPAKNNFFRLVATLSCLSLLGQPLVAAAQIASATPAFNYRVPLEGNDQSQLTAGALQMMPATHDFGVVVLGSAASTTTTLKNTGQDAVSLTDFALAAPFTQSNGCPSVLVGGAACTLTVTYTPSGAGTHSGSLAVPADPASAATSFGLTGTAVVPTTSLALSLNVVDFGDSDVGVQAPNKSIKITNTGNSPATVNGIGVSSGAGEFNQSNNCFAKLAPGAFCTVSLTYVPSAYGNQSGNLTIYEEASSALYSVALNGSGNAAVMSLSPGTANFTSAIANYASTSAQVTVYNNGNRPLNGLSFSTNSAEYSVTGNTCTAALAPNTNCLVTVRFAPTAAGARPAKLSTFSTNGGSADVNLSGNGIAQAPAVSASVPALTFNVVAVDDSSTTQSVTYSNTGNVSVTLGAVTISAGSTHYSSSTTCGATLAVGATCTASVVFTPRAAGSQPGNLRAPFSSGVLDTALTGTGTLGEATVSPTNLSFADQQVASASAAKVVTITNTGNRKLTFSGVSVIAGAANFAQSNNCAMVLPAGTCTVSVTFTPSTATGLTGTLALMHDGVNGTTTVDLSGTGRSQAATLSTPNFASTAVGASSTAVATLANTGIGALTVTPPTAGSVTGTGYSFVSTTCGASVAVSASCTTTVRFSPTTTTAASGTLNIATGAGAQSASFGSTGIQGFATVNPSSLSYAAQQVSSTSSSKVVTVTNTGTATLTFTSVGISDGASDFAQTNGCASVAVGGTCTVNVAFTPSTTGARLGTLALVHNGGGIATVDLSGTGQGQSASLTPLAFADTAAGSYRTLNATLTNTGIGALSVTVPTAASVTGPLFSFVTTTCGTSLAVGATCTSTIRFSPNDGGAKTGNLTIATGAGSQSVALTGSGTQAVLAFSSPSTTTINWGNRQVGGSYISSVVTLTNSGNVPASGLVLTPTSVWTLASNTCTSTLNAASSCTFVMMFNPAAAQAYTGAVTAASSGTLLTNQMTLSGTGVAQSGTLSTPSFPPTAVNGTNTAVATLSNTGLGDLAVTVPTAGSVTGAGYSFVSTTCASSLAVSGTCSVTVRFSPTSTVAASGSLTVGTGAGSKVVALGSTGIQGFASVSPSSLTYATQQNGTTSAVQVVTVTNTGTNTLTFTGVGISSGISDYAQSNNCGSVAVSGTCTVSVTFTPSATGSRPGDLSFTHNGGGIANVTLTGTGQAASATLSTPSFATTSVGGTNTATALLTNTGIGSLSITVPAAGSVTGTDFSFVSTTCTASLAAGGSCTSTIRFSPTSTTARTGTLTLATGAGSQVASLAATAVQSNASLSASSLTFAPKQVGDSAPAQVVTVTNNGTTALVFTSVSVTSGAADFTQASPACTTLAVNGTCTMTVNFTPTAGNARTGTVTLAHNGTGATTIGLSGTGQYQTAILSTPSFAPTAVGATNTGTSTLTNTGIGALSVTTPAAGSVTGSSYSFVSTTCGTSLPVSGTCSTTVRFSPTSTATASGMLSIATGDGTKLATLGSTGIQGFASVSPSSLTYGPQQNSTTSAVQVVTVTNTGTNTLTFTGVGISAGATDFAQSNNCGSVAVSGTCTVNVTFTPSTAGSRPGNLMFTHNGGGIANVSLTGTGQVASASLSAVSFEGVNAGATSDLTSTLSNTGLGSITVTVPVAGSVTGSEFAFVSTTCGTSLASGATCATTVRFAPVSGGIKSGNLSIVTSAGTQSGALSGTGNQAVLALSYLNGFPVYWGNRQVGSVNGSTMATLTNSGTAPATTLTLTPSAGYSLYSNTCVSTLNAGASCTFYLNFSPVAVQAYAGTMTVAATNASVTNQMTMNGNGVAPSATLSTPSFSPTAVGSTSTAVATLTNTGVGDLAVTVPTAGSITGASYSFVSTTCGTSVAASGSCTVTVRFSPTSTSASTGALNVATGAGTKSVTLGSTGIQGYASVSPGSLTFGTTGLWATSPVQTVTVTNTGTNTLTFTGVGISVGSSDFAQSNNCGSVAVNGTCTVNVTFSPSTGGARTGTLSFTHNGGGVANVSLSGTGHHPYASLSMGSFPTTAVGSSSTAVATLTNNSTYGPMPVGGPVITGSSAFTVVSTTCSSMIPASGNCTTSVRFSPTSTATQTGNFAINDWNQWHNAALSATGLQPGVSLSAAGISFPNETAGRSSSQLSMTLTNSGNTTLTISNMYLSSGVADFTVMSTNCVGQMGPGGTCTVTARFAPTSAGFKSGTMAFAHNGAGPSSFTVSGTGYAPAAITSRSFSPTVITVGNNSTYSWTTSSATSVNVTCSNAISIIGGSTTALNGSVTVRGNSAGTGSCFIAAYNVLGTGTGDSIDMSVVAAPFVQSGLFNPTSVMAGNTSTFTWSTNYGTSATVSCAYPASGSGSGLSGSITVSTAAAGTGSCTTTVYNAAGNSGSYQANLTVTPAYTYSWQAGGYSTPAACGATTATRTVWCQRSDGATVADGFCGGGKPATTTGTTDYSACSYNFEYSGWSTPNGCGAVTETRTAQCRRSDGAIVANSSCGTPTLTQGATNYNSCSYAFEYGAWSSPTGCGAVTQTRTAQCRRSDGAIVADSSCGAPTTSQGAADYRACTYSANLGAWGSCSTGCGTGTQSRTVSCTRSDGATVDNSSCGSPANAQSCTETASCCPETQKWCYYGNDGQAQDPNDNYAEWGEVSYYGPSCTMDSWSTRGSVCPDGY